MTHKNNGHMEFPTKADDLEDENAWLGREWRKWEEHRTSGWVYQG